MEEKNTNKDTIVEDIQEKIVELELKAANDQKWYKKLGFYVAAAAGAVLAQLINNYGDQLLDIIKSVFGL